MNRQHFLRALVLGACLSCTGPALAQQPSSAWPTQPIRLINPFPAGGPTDGTSRWLAERVGKELGQTIVVENVPGASGSLGMRRVAQAQPDGYTIGYGYTGTHVLAPALYPKVGYDPIKDFTFIAQLKEYSNVLVVKADKPYRTLADLIEAARKAPGTISYGSAGNGSSNHLSGVMLEKMADVKFIHAPYRGSAPALMDLLAGNIAFMFDEVNTPQSTPYIQNGTLRALAVTNTERVPEMPNVPTVAESYPGYVFQGRSGIVAPAGVPAPIVERLSAAIGHALNSPEGKAWAAANGANFKYAPSAEFAEHIKKDIVTWVPIVKESGARVE